MSQKTKVSKTDQNSKQQATNISQTAMASQCIPTVTKGHWSCGRRLTLAANAKAYSATTVFPAEVWAATNTDSFLSKWYIAYTQNIEPPISVHSKSSEKSIVHETRIDCYEIPLGHSKTLFQKRVLQVIFETEDQPPFGKCPAQRGRWEPCLGQDSENCLQCPPLPPSLPTPAQQILQLPKLKISNTVYEDWTSMVSKDTSTIIDNRYADNIV